MPKFKSHSGAKKRFAKTGNGKVKRSKAFRRHHSWAKSQKSVRQLRNTGYLEGADERRIAKLLPS